MRACWLSWLCSWGILVAVPGVVMAQAERPSIEVARARMEQGQAYYLQGRFLMAASEFEAAYAAEPFSAFLYNAAVAFENAGSPDRAITYFGRYLASDPRASDRAAVEQRVGRLQLALDASRAAGTADPLSSGAPVRGPAEVATAPGEPVPTGAVVVPEGAPSEANAAAAQAPADQVPGSPDVASSPPPSGTPTASTPADLPRDFKSLVSVRTTPDGATVTVVDSGGREVARGYSPYSATLEQGAYRLRIQHSDFNVAEQDVTIEPGKVYVVVVNLSQGEFLGYVRVVTEPPGADVFIDDRSIGARGQTPFEGPLPVGSHRVWVERPGFAAVEREVDVQVGRVSPLRVDLARVAFGRVRVLASTAGGWVSIDGERVGAVPWEGDVPAGPHALRVESNGMKTWSRAIEVQRGQLTPVRVRLRPDVNRSAAWVTGVFGVLAAGAGVALGVVADEFRRGLQLDRDAGVLATSDPRIDQGFYLTIGADGAFGLAGILGALSLYYAVYDPLPPSEGTVLEPRDWALAPLVEPRAGGLGVALTGRF